MVRPTTGAPGCKGPKKRYNENALTQHLWSKRDEPGHRTSQFEAWDKEGKQGNYVRPAMPNVVGQWAHIVGAEPTWVYLFEKPDYSKHVEAREPENSSSDNSEGEESEEETVEVEEAGEEEQPAQPAC